MDGDALMTLVSVSAGPELIRKVGARVKVYKTHQDLL